jgi:hypothetical protein
VKTERITLGKAMAKILKEDSGLKCPHGCKGCSTKMYGLVKHLMDVHGYTEKKAWKKAEE